MPQPAQLIHDVVTKTAMIIHNNQTLVVRGKFRTTEDALTAARIQYPNLYEPSNKRRH